MKNLGAKDDANLGLWTVEVVSPAGEGRVAIEGRALRHQLRCTLFAGAQIWMIILYGACPEQHKTRPLKAQAKNLYGRMLSGSRMACTIDR
eukprot:scaffold85340_cov69-Phaeocystis_antarctica.AAC.6